MLDVGGLAHTIGAVLTDIDRAEAVVEELGRALADDPKWGHRILEAPHIDQVSALDEYGVTLRVTTKVKASEQWPVGGELRKRILMSFASHGIQIATPQRLVFPQAGHQPSPTIDMFPTTDGVPVMAGVEAQAMPAEA